MRECILSATRSMKDELIEKMTGWLQSVGVPVRVEPIAGATFLPGLAIEIGTLVVDPARLEWPGDMLHEAGHIALAAPSCRAALGGKLDVTPGEEMAALAWSYAAAVAAGVDPAVVFHEGGYKLEGPQLQEAFAGGNGPGVPMLQWYRMTRSYPRMEKWIRDCEDPTA
jgi:hypothetical protein